MPVPLQCSNLNLLRAWVSLSRRLIAKMPHSMYRDAFADEELSSRYEAYVKAFEAAGDIDFPDCFSRITETEVVLSRGEVLDHEEFTLLGSAYQLHEVVETIRTALTDLRSFYDDAQQDYLEEVEQRKEAESERDEAKELAQERSDEIEELQSRIDDLEDKVENLESDLETVWQERRQLLAKIHRLELEAASEPAEFAPNFSEAG